MSAALVTIAKGLKFRHDHLLDVAWEPGPGELWADSPKAVMQVTLVRRGRVYFAYAPSTGGMYAMPLKDVENRFATGRWQVVP